MTSPPKTRKLTLILDGGLRRELPPGRFTIGRGDDNDLVVAVQGVSRRHATIDNINGEARLADCGSQNGTFVNGRQVGVAVALADGDVISLGSVYEVRVSLPEHDHARVETAPALKIAVGAIGAIVLVAGLAIVILKLFGAGPDPNGQQLPPGFITPSLVPSPTPPEDDAVRQIEQAVRGAISRASNNSAPPTIPATKYLEMIRDAAEMHRGSARLGAAIEQLRQNRSSLRTWSENQFELNLLAYAALAETNGDPDRIVPTARQIAPRLIEARKLYDADVGDKMLICLAAFKIGKEVAGEHPLNRKMKEAGIGTNERNVWALYEKRALGGTELEFIIKFLAYGIVAHDPTHYGISAKSLSY